MRVLFRKDAWVFWWGIVSAIAFCLATRQLGGTLNGLVDFFSSPSFRSTELPFRITSGLDWVASQIFTFVIARIQFDPAKTIISIGSFTVPNIVFLIVLMILALVVLWKIYDRAIDTDNPFDDLIVLIVFLLLLGVSSDLLNLYGVGLLKVGWVKALVIGIFVLAAILGGRREALNRLDVFAEASRIIALAALFLWPRETAGLLFQVGRALESFGKELFLKPQIPALGFWLLTGFYSAKLWWTVHSQSSPSHQP